MNTLFDKTRSKKNVPTGRVILRLFLAFAALLSMRVNIEVVEGLEMPSALLNIVSRVPPLCASSPAGRPQRKPSMS